MNECKIRRILEWIRSQGKLPTDAYGQILSVNDLTLVVISYLIISDGSPKRLNFLISL